MTDTRTTIKLNRQMEYIVKLVMDTNPLASGPTAAVEEALREWYTNHRRDVMYTQEQDEIIELVGAENWQMVVDEFGGKTVLQIKAILDEMFPTEDNRKLTQCIFNELN